MSPAAGVPEHQISPRIRVFAGDPVRLFGKRGIYRFVQAWPEKGTAEVIGPAKRPLSRVVLATELRSAGRATADAAGWHPGLKGLSDRAKAGRKRLSS